MNNPFYNTMMQPRMQQQAPQMPQQVSQMPQQPMDERIWVQSEIAAEAYLVGANNTVTLWDSAKPIIYVKSADIYGRPLPLEKYEYRKIDEEQQSVDFTNALDDLRTRIEALEQKGSKNAKSKSNSDDATVKAVYE